MFVMKRYQNPEVFERLAMSYALGTLQGRARQRFERLLAKHFYLRAVTDAYQHQFSGMVDILPPVEPPAHVWRNLEQELGLPVQRRMAKQSAHSKRPFWLSWQWPATALAGVLLGFFIAFGVSQQQPGVDHNRMYAAVMTPSYSDEPMVYATVSKDEMKLSVQLLQVVDLPADRQLTLWCLPKDEGGETIRMATISPEGKTSMPIDKAMWQGLQGVSEFAVSAEPMDQPDAGEPKGEVMYKGKLLTI